MNALIWIAALAAAAPPLPGPLAPAARGQVQCYAPDAARKTCAAMAAYEAGPGGGIDNTASSMVSRSPLVVMRTRSPVVVRDSRVCGAITAASLDEATFTAGGQPATDEQTRTLRGQMRQLYSGMLDKEICTAYAKDGKRFQAQVWLEGRRQPALDQVVVWVAPADGYRVSP